MIRFLCLLVAPFLFSGSAQTTVELKANFKPGDTRRMTVTHTQEVYKGAVMESRTTEDNRCQITVLRNDDKLVLSYSSSSSQLSGEQAKKLSAVQLAAADAISKRLGALRVDVEVDPVTLDAARVLNMPEVLGQVGGIFESAATLIPDSIADWEERADAVELLKTILMIGAFSIEKEALFAVDIMLQYYSFPYVLGEEVTYEATGMDESIDGLFSGYEFPLDMDIRSRLDANQNLSGDITSYYEKSSFVDACNEVLPPDNGIPYDEDEVSGYEREKLLANLETGWISSLETTIQMVIRDYTVISEQRLILR